MKKFITGALMVCAMLMAVPAAQAGGFKVGPKVGLNVNKFSMDSNTFDSDNRCGFTGGIDAQFTVPLLGIGADISVMYTRRNTSNEVKTPILDAITNQVGSYETNVEKTHYDYISVPVHLMYKLDLPAINKIVAPYVVTGPDFAFRISKNLLDDVQAKKCNVGWDFGIGVELIKHLQVSATYTLGINNAVKYASFVGVPGAADFQKTEIKGNTNGWTISAAWMF